ncbi:MAG: glycosyltransferase family 2 protein [Neisseria sp.]|nr:glycosyltransferase family 2 protein [Neisseria sp.]
MKISFFTFVKNARMLGYPFLESIASALPLADEFVINVGPCEDDTLELLQEWAGREPKLRIIRSTWCNQMQQKGYVYGQQKMIAQFNCTGDWAFYLEADEVLHEDDLPRLRALMEQYADDPQVEAIAFDYLHFYGNPHTYLDSPAWYKKEVRIIKTSVRSYAPDGLFWVVLDKSNKDGRYPYAVESGATIYHYGWVRSNEEMNRKGEQVGQYWSKAPQTVDYREIDPTILRLFSGNHPAVMNEWFKRVPEAVERQLFAANPAHVLTRREKKHRLLMKLEQLFGFSYTKKHYRKVG